MVNGPDDLFVERKGRIERVAGYAVAWNRIDVTMASAISRS